MADQIGNVVMPGDVLRDTKLFDGDKKILLGPGLVEDGGCIKFSKPGILRYRDPGVYWLDCHQKRVSYLAVVFVLPVLLLFSLHM